MSNRLFLAKIKNSDDRDVVKYRKLLNKNKIIF